MSNRLTNLIATFLLIFIFLVAIFSIKDDSLTMDELAHLPAGYSYLTQKDMRLNPEHPPLIKDFAAFPLLFIKDIKFPSEIKAWKNDVNGQWEFGNYFLFKTGNPADKMIFWARVPMLLVLILLGFFLFKWTKELFGNKAAVLSLTLFSFSPTLLAHGRLVTTDVGAAIGVFIATYYFLNALKEPTQKRIIISGLALGFALLLKFTTVILIPFFVLLALLHYWSVRNLYFRKIILHLFYVFIIAAVLIWPVYFYHTFNYPSEKQAGDIKYLLSSHPFQFLGPALAKMAYEPVLKPYAQYLLGLSLNFQRGVSGNTGYFLGEVSSEGWKQYFPVVYSIKEPLAFHILTLIALLYGAWLIKRPFWQDTIARLKNLAKNHFPELAMFLFILIYWTFSVISSLNIGVRHLLPVFPFTIMLISAGIISWLGSNRSKLKYSALLLLIFWQIISVSSVYPHYLSYFNEIAGGADNGYQFVVDSNYDWGQDLKRLAKFVEENKISKIKVDYFGGGDVKYYLDARWDKFDPKSGPQKGWLAISATLLQGGRGSPVPGFNEPTGYYNWLNNYEPIARAGKSIFIYYIP